MRPERAKTPLPPCRRSRPEYRAPMTQPPAGRTAQHAGPCGPPEINPPPLRSGPDASGPDAGWTALHRPVATASTTCQRGSCTTGGQCAGSDAGPPRSGGHARSRQASVLTRPRQRLPSHDDQCCGFKRKGPLAGGQCLASSKQRVPAATNPEVSRRHPNALQLRAEASAKPHRPDSLTRLFDGRTDQRRAKARLPRWI